MYGIYDIKRINMKKKKIYLINLPDDAGELWLGEDKKPLEWIHCNDAIWRDEYQGFIIEYLGGELIDVYPKFTDDDIEKLYDLDCKEKIYKVVEKYLKDV